MRYNMHSRRSSCVPPSIFFVVAWLSLVGGPGHRSLSDVRCRNRDSPNRRTMHYAEQQRYLMTDRPAPYLDEPGTFDGLRSKEGLWKGRTNMGGDSQPKESECASGVLPK